ncbi:hypothetical protein G6O67_004901 [Ophiocordyceps sinensis]|uniref:FHA domain-containing protein n=1 Tax=Ophiocordyceps sinensis TaxID=72228 RepID=A0A8H4PQD5_9HYPO|nr:hypothetical protein G6O67_004901 [Ophiocordyceps sinensis]
MAPAESFAPKSSRRRDEEDNSAGDSCRHRDRDSRRERRSGRSSRERRGSSRTRRRSRTPESSHRRHHRQRDHGGDRGRDRVREKSPGRDRGREESNGRERRRRFSRHDERSDRRRSDDADRDYSSKHDKSVIKHKAPLPSQQDSFAIHKGEEWPPEKEKVKPNWGNTGALAAVHKGEEERPEKEKVKPNWGNTGALAAASNSVVQADGTSTTLKYHEPSEARKPSPRDEWKLFVFKGGDIVDTINLNLKSCWLVGRDAGVADLMAEHPSISKQHAVIQFRYMEKRNEFGDKTGRVKPYLLDLDSANGTVLNDGPAPPSRYLELRHKDMLLFGHSTRQYVVMLAPRG